MKATRLTLEPRVSERLRQASLDYDLSVSSLANAIIEAAFRTGTVDRMILDSSARGKVRITRRLMPADWVSTGPGGRMFREYMLTRVGHGGVLRPGEGWYLEGPGIERCYMGANAREAQVNATQLVARVQSEENVQEYG